MCRAEALLCLHEVAELTACHLSPCRGRRDQLLRIEHISRRLTQGRTQHFVALHHRSTNAALHPIDHPRHGLCRPNARSSPRSNYGREAHERRQNHQAIGEHAQTAFDRRHPIPVDRRSYSWEQTQALSDQVTLPAFRVLLHRPGSQRG